MDTNNGRRINGKVVLAGSAGLVLGGVVGGLLGYLLARDKAEKRANWRIASEVEAARAHYLARANAAGKGDHPDQWAASALGEEPGAGSPARLGPGRVDYAGAGRGAKAPSGPVPARSGHGGGDSSDSLEGEPGAGDEDEDHGEYDEEDGYDGGEYGTRPDGGPLPPPDRRTPFVITLGQFHDEDPPHTKISITYYSADKILVDDKDNVIRNWGPIVGDDFADHFGEGSEDPEIVFIRNYHFEADYEIIRDDRAYAQVVARQYGKPQ